MGRYLSNEHNRIQRSGGEVKVITILRLGIEYPIYVDDEDFPLLNRHDWHLLPSNDRLYAYAPIHIGKGERKMMPMTHMILGSCYHVDHADNNSLNNQKYNLRPASWQQNQWNKGKPKSGRHGKPTSQYKGVSYRPLKGKDRWLAILKHVEEGKHKSTGKIIRIGYFDSEIEAAKAYNAKVRELRGDWAWINPIPEINYDRSNVEETK